MPPGHHGYAQKFSGLNPALQIVLVAKWITVRGHHRHEPKAPPRSPCSRFHKEDPFHVAVAGASAFMIRSPRGRTGSHQPPPTVFTIARRTAKRHAAEDGQKTYPEQEEASDCRGWSTLDKTAQALLLDVLFHMRHCLASGHAHDQRDISLPALDAKCCANSLPGSVQRFRQPRWVEKPACGPGVIRGGLTRNQCRPYSVERAGAED